jgi:homoserine kinase
MQDKLHQPYRSEAAPLLPLLEPLAGQAGILGVALSGAGPSVLLVLARDAVLEDVERLVSQKTTPIKKLEGTEKFQSLEMLPCSMERRPTSCELDTI